MSSGRILIMSVSFSYLALTESLNEVTNFFHSLYPSLKVISNIVIDKYSFLQLTRM